MKDFHQLMFWEMKRRERKHFSMYCLQLYSSQEHYKENCMVIKIAQFVTMPKKDELLLQGHSQLNCRIPLEGCCTTHSLKTSFKDNFFSNNQYLAI